MHSGAGGPQPFASRRVARLSVMQVKHKGRDRSGEGLICGTSCEGLFAGAQEGMRMTPGVGNEPWGPLQGNRKEWFKGVIPSFPAENFV